MGKCKDPYKIKMSEVRDPHDKVNIGKILKKLNKGCILISDLPGGEWWDIRVVGLVPDKEINWPKNWTGRSWKGIMYRNIRGAACVVNGWWATTAHEIGHTYGLWIEYPKDGEEYRDNHPGNKAPGYWVNERVDKNTNTICFMGNVNRYRFLCNTWFEKTEYKWLLSKKFTLIDPELILISGTAWKNNDTIKIDDFYRIPAGAPDLQERGTGNCEILFLDKGEGLISKVGFDITFTTKEDEPKEVNVTYFVFDTVFPPETAKIQVVYKGNIVAEKTVNEHSPTVTITYPNGGEVLHQGETHTITWDAYDLDGDEMSYTVGYSYDGGKNWTPLAMDLKSSEFTWRILHNPPGNEYLIKVIATDGVNTGKDTSDATFTIAENIFDTGTPANPYPSISGTFNGTIKPNCTINATKLYTYPCEGTGGHTEYAFIWNDTWNATAYWKGYTGDWHNITFSEPFTLVTNETYNYTIRTGSYPQIIHESAFNATGGEITCTEFTDANGKRYDNWIPAIRLWS